MRERQPDVQMLKEKRKTDEKEKGAPVRRSQETGQKKTGNQ